MPVAIVSCRPSTHRMPGAWSSAATKCISLVPGLAKQVSTQQPISVSTRLRAPFIREASLPSARLHEPQHELVRARLVRRLVARVCGPAHERAFALEHESGALDLGHDEGLLDPMQRLAGGDPG